MSNLLENYFYLPPHTYTNDFWQEVEIYCCGVNQHTNIFIRLKIGCEQAPSKKINNPLLGSKEINKHCQFIKLFLRLFFFAKSTDRFKMLLYIYVKRVKQDAQEKSWLIFNILINIIFIWEELRCELINK